MISNLHAETNIDQWQDSNKTYKDLIEEGFEVKAACKRVRRQL